MTKKCILLILIALCLHLKSFAQNNALHFDGTDYISFNSPISGNPDFTIEGSFIIENNSILNHIISWGIPGSTSNGSTFSILDVQGNFSIHDEAFDNQSYIQPFSGTTIRDNAWHWFAISKTGTLMTIYLDNQSYSYDRGVKDMNLVLSAVIGRNSSLIGEGWKGQIDEIRIWGSGRSSTEIMASRNCNLEGNEACLVGYWNFDQGVPGADNKDIAFLNDLSSNNNDGVLNNFSLVGNSSNWVVSDSQISGDCVDVTCEDTEEPCVIDCCTGENEGFETYPIGPLPQNATSQNPSYTALNGGASFVMLGCQDDISIELYPPGQFQILSQVDFDAGSGIAGPLGLFVEDEYYCISFCIKMDSPQSYGSLSFLNGFTLIGTSQTIYDTDGWVQVQLPIWQADVTTNGYTLVGGGANTNDPFPVPILIDNICIENVGPPAPCYAAFEYEIRNCGQVCFTDLSCGDNYNISWTLDGNPFNLSNNNCYTFTSSKNYEICLDINQSDCTNRQCQILEIMLNIDPPTITCPPSITLNTDDNICEANISLDNPSHTIDNCSTGFEVNCVRDDGLDENDPYPVGTTTITCQITDSYGQMASCSYSVTVEDLVPPSFGCPPDLTLNAEPGKCINESYIFIIRDVIDNCAMDDFMCVRDDNQDLNDPWPLGSTLVSCTASDVNGNVSTCETYIIVEDNEPPSIACPSDIVVNSSDPNGTTINWPSIVAKDNCVIKSQSCDYNVDTVFPCGETVITCFVEDEAGLKSECSFKVRVICQAVDTFCGKAVVTCFSGVDGTSNNQRIPNPDGPVLGIIDIQDRTGVNLGMNWNQASSGHYHHSDWIARNLGEIFGLALDQIGNIYTCNSTVYGAHPFGPLGGGGVYKINSATGTITDLVALPNGSDPTKGPGLGNICYSKKYDLLYITNFYDGLIYIVNPNTGGIESTFDPFQISVPDQMSSYAFIPLEDRPWAVGINPLEEDKLYFSNWSTYSISTSGIIDNRIYSVDLDAMGYPYGNEHLEISSQIFGFPTSNFFIQSPISDIAFSNDGLMLVAERSMEKGDIIPATASYWAHYSGVVEYEKNATGNWQVTPGHDSPYLFGQDFKYEIGITGLRRNAAGGVDYGYGSFTQGSTPNVCDAMVWATGDALSPTHGSGAEPWIYGLQGIPNTGGNSNNSFLIDFNNNVSTWDKTQIGDVEIFKCITCAEDTTDCELLSIDISPIETRGDTCCYSIDINNDVGPNITSLCINLENSPGWIINTANSNTGLIIDQPNSTQVCISEPTGFLTGSNSNVLEFCLAELQNNTDLSEQQCIISTWYMGELQTECSDTFKLSCDTIVSNPCMSYANLKADCNPENDYTYCLCFDLTNQSGLDANELLLENLTSGFQFISGCNSSGYYVPFDSWGYTLNPLLDTGTDNFCVNIISNNIISQSSNISFQATLFNQRECCSSPLLIEAELIPCCIPCEEINSEVSILETTEEDSCCYSLNLTNDCGYNFFSKLEVEILTQGVYFGYHGNGYPQDWSMCNVTPQLLCLEPSIFGSIPKGDLSNLLDFCLTDVNLLSELPQEIKISYFTLDDDLTEIVACDTIIELNCPLSNNPCVFVFDEEITCDTLNNKYLITANIKNLSNPDFTAYELTFHPLSILSKIDPPFISLTPPLSNDGSSRNVSFCYTPDIFPDPDGILPISWWLKSLAGDTCCVGTEMYEDTLILPSCPKKEICCNSEFYELQFEQVINSLSIEGCKVSIDPTALDTCASLNITWGDGFGDAYPNDNLICYTYDLSGDYDICFHVEALADIGTAPCIQLDSCVTISAVCPPDCCENELYEQQFEQVINSLLIEECKVSIDPTALDTCAILEINWGDGFGDSYTIDDLICYTYDLSGDYDICFQINVWPDIGIAPCIQLDSCGTISVNCPKDCCDYESYEQQFEQVINSLSIEECKVSIDPTALDTCTSLNITWGDGFGDAYPNDNLICYTYDQSGDYDICFHVEVLPDMALLPCVLLDSCISIRTNCDTMSMCCLEFKPHVNNPFSLTGQKAQTGYDFVDFDGDGDLDYVYTNDFIYFGLVVRENILGTFNPAISLGLGNLTNNNEFKHLFEFGGDLFAIHEGELIYSENNFNGIVNFQTWQFDLENGQALNLDDPYAICDFDADGYGDLISLDVQFVNGNRTLFVYLHPGIPAQGNLPQFSTKQLLFSGLTSPNLEFPNLDLYDGDCDDDCDLYLTVEGELWFFENTGSFNNPIISSSITTINPYGIKDLAPNGITEFVIPRFVDIDGDGDTELFIDDNIKLQFYENCEGIADICSCGLFNGWNAVNTSFGTIPCGDSKMIPIGHSQDINVFGFYHCQEGCAPGSIDWVLSKPDGSSLNGTINGGTYSFDILISEFSDAGVYGLSLDPSCGTLDCEACMISFIKENPCECIPFAEVTYENFVTGAQTQIACGGVLELDEPIDDFSLLIPFACSDLNCMESNDWVLSFPDQTTLTGNFNQGVNTLTLGAADFTQIGDYQLALNSSCDNNSCQVCTINITVKEACACKGHQEVMLQTANQNYDLDCTFGSPVILSECPKQDPILSLTASINCGSCIATDLNWELVHLETGTTIIMKQAAPLSNGMYHFDLSNIDFDLPGTYSFTNSALCDNDKCFCYPSLIVPDECGCTCEDLTSNPPMIHQFGAVLGSCKRKFRMDNVGPCDMVRWKFYESAAGVKNHIDTQNSMGNGTVTFMGNNMTRYLILAIITRTLPNGQKCQNVTILQYFEVYCIGSMGGGPVYECDDDLVIDGDLSNGGSSWNIMGQAQYIESEGCGTDGYYVINGNAEQGDVLTQKLNGTIDPTDAFTLSFCYSPWIADTDGIVEGSKIIISTSNTDMITWDCVDECDVIAEIDIPKGMELEDDQVWINKVDQIEFTGLKSHIIIHVENKYTNSADMISSIAVDNICIERNIPPIDVCCDAPEFPIMVAEGFDIIMDCVSGEAYADPKFLNECDEINWYVDGVLNASSTGDQVVALTGFLSSNTYLIQMSVKRINVSDSLCLQATVEKTIIFDCPACSDITMSFDRDQTNEEGNCCYDVSFENKLNNDKLLYLELSQVISGDAYFAAKGTWTTDFFRRKIYPATNHVPTGIYPQAFLLCFDNIFDVDISIDLNWFMETSPDSSDYTVCNSEWQFKCETDAVTELITPFIFSLYPNPSTSIFNISFEDKNQDQLKIEVYNLTGQVITNELLSDGTNHSVIDLSNQTSGIYFISVSDKNGNRITKKAIKI